MAVPSPSPELRLGLAQVASRSGSFEANLEAHLELVRRAAEARADIVVFAELSLTGYSVSEDELATWNEMRCIERLAAEAPGVVVVAGAPVGGPARPSNSAIAVCRGRVAHRQDKLHLPSYPPFDEGDRFTSATEIGTFDVLGWRLAILICEDAWHIGLTERLAGLDVDVAIHMAASAEGSDGVLAGNRRGWPLVNAALALLGGRYVAFVNQVGQDRELWFWGGSALYAPDGQELSALGDESGLTIAVLRRATLDAQRKRLPVSGPGTPRP